MALRVESAAAMQDHLTYQLWAGRDIYGPELGGYSALMKAHSTKVRAAASKVRALPRRIGG